MSSTGSVSSTGITSSAGSESSTGIVSSGGSWRYCE